MHNILVPTPWCDFSIYMGISSPSVWKRGAYLPQKLSGVKGEIQDLGKEELGPSLERYCCFRWADGGPSELLADTLLFYQSLLGH